MFLSEDFQAAVSIAPNLCHLCRGPSESSGTLGRSLGSARTISLPISLPVCFSVIPTHSASFQHETNGTFPSVRLERKKCVCVLACWTVGQMGCLHPRPRAQAEAARGPRLWRGFAGNGGKALGTRQVRQALSLRLCVFRCCRFTVVWTCFVCCAGLSEVGVARFSKQTKKIRDDQINSGTYTHKKVTVIVVYLKFRFNWAAWVSSGGPRGALSVRDLAPSLGLSWEVVLCFVFDNMFPAFSLSEILLHRCWTSWIELLAFMPFSPIV